MEATTQDDPQKETVLEGRVYGSDDRYAETANDEVSEQIAPAHAITCKWPLLSAITFSCSGDSLNATVVKTVDS